MSDLPIICITSKSQEDAEQMHKLIASLVPDSSSKNLKVQSCSSGILRRDATFGKAHKIILCVPCSERILIDDPNDPDDYKNAWKLAHNSTISQTWPASMFYRKPEKLVMILLFNHRESGPPMDGLYWLGFEDTVLIAQPNVKAHADIKRFVSIDSAFNEMQLKAICKFVQTPVHGFRESLTSAIARKKAAVAGFFSAK